jgi:hypothetical protein
MKFWTTQTETVIDIILNQGTYKPDFNLSDGFGGINMKSVYDEMLNVYSSKNNIDCKGLIFGITNLDDEPVKNIEQFKSYFIDNSDFWDSITHAGEEYAILEIEVPDEIDLIPIYFQDFIVLGMRSLRDYGFQNYVKPQLADIKFQDFYSDLIIAQTKGWTDDTGFDLGISTFNKIVQAHIHQIQIEYIKGVYGTYDYESETEYSLGKKAMQLSKYINSKQ